MKQLNADALIISVIGLSWLCGVMVTYLAITVYSAIRRYEKHEKIEVPGENIDLDYEYSENPYVCGQ